MALVTGPDRNWPFGSSTAPASPASVATPSQLQDFPQRVSVGLVSVVWVTGTELAHSAVASHSLQLRHATPFLYVKGYDGAAGIALGDSSGG